MKKDDVRTLIIVIIICALITSLILILNRESNSDKLTIMTSRNMYFAAIDYANIYLNNVKEENEEIVYDLLDTMYIENENVTVDNVFDKVESYEDSTSLKVKQMDYFEIDNAYVIMINGTIYNNIYEDMKEVDDDFKILLIIDNKTNSFSIYPILDNNYKKIINKIKKINIKENKNNKLITSKTISEEQMCVLYMSDYVSMISKNIKEAYSLLTNKMKERYSDVDSYKEYIDSNKDKFTTIADKCRVTEKDDDARTYYVIDGNENEYIFYEDGIMNYEVEYYLK